MGYNELLNRTIHETETDNLKEKVERKELSLDIALKRIEKFITLSEKRGLTEPIKKH